MAPPRVLVDIRNAQLVRAAAAASLASASAATATRRGAERGPPAAAAWGLRGLLGLPLSRVSSGQRRRVRLAQTLVFAERAGLAVLDEPFTGLDARARGEVAALIGGVAEAAEKEAGNVGPRFPVPLLLLREHDGVPEWVTHVLELDTGHVAWQGAADEFHRRHAANEGSSSFWPGWRADGAALKMSTTAVEVIPATGPAAAARHAAELARSDGDGCGRVLVDMRDVCVTTVDGQAVLRGVWWAVRAGEAWRVRGGNGTGKTTLLAVLRGDHPQAYANDVRVFGQQRGVVLNDDDEGNGGAGYGTRMPLAELQRRVPLVSGEAHAEAARRARRDAALALLAAGGGAGGAAAAGPSLLDVASGRWDSSSVGASSPSSTWAASEAAAAEVLEELGVRAAGRRFLAAASGEQRLALIARALVASQAAAETGAHVVVLDEPFQGLDTDGVRRVQEAVGRRLGGSSKGGGESALVLVTHYDEEVPGYVDRVLDLEAQS
ncbi:hypothetical protein HK405_012572 [Cladochytrium tenue]|nr:hypothetical protein HK405_012572 [Cladochytrium tenue]